MYKYFKESEIVGLNEKLVQMLDSAREIAGIPFIITSGLRTPEKNAEVGGVPDSSHLSGLAVDLKINNNQERYSMVFALLKSGFKRLEIAPNHIHVDIDENKVQRVVFLPK